MFILVCILIILIVLLFAFISAQKKEMSAPKNTSDTNETYKFGSAFKLIDGIEGWGQATSVIKIELFETEMIFYSTVFGNSSKSIKLKYEQVTCANVYSEKEIIEKSKNVIGRAAVGAALFGPVGAIVGGLSGTGTKSSNKTNYYYTIHYNSSNGEPKMITLSTDCASCDMYEFDKVLKQYIKNETPDYL